MKLPLQILRLASILVLFIFVSIFDFQAQAQTQSQKKRIPLLIDVASFRYDISKTRIELYYSFPDTSMSYSMNNGKYVGEMYVGVAIKSASNTVASTEWIVSNISEKQPRGYAKDLIGAKTFLLPSGHYTVELTLADVTKMKDTMQCQTEIVVPSFSTDKLDMSSLELASSIRSTAELSGQNFNPMFVKNSLEVIPNPSWMYTDTAPSLKFYAEVYNAKKFSPAGFAMKYSVFDGVHREIFTIVQKRKSIGDSLVEYESIPVDALPSGLYYFRATMLNDLENPTDSSSKTKKFYILNSQMPASMEKVSSEDEEFLLSEFSGIEGARLVDEYERSKVIFNPDERKMYEAVATDRERQRYLFRFWKGRDPDPNTVVNEKRVKFNEAVEYANSHFSNSLQKNGWKTDRGKVMRQYGIPDHVDRFTHKVDTRPYETWFYSGVQGGVNFYFVDMNGVGNYTLVHSDAYGENHYENWYARYVQVIDQNTNLDPGK